MRVKMVRHGLAEMVLELGKSGENAIFRSFSFAFYLA